MWYDFKTFDKALTDWLSSHFMSSIDAMSLPQPLNWELSENGETYDEQLNKANRSIWLKVKSEKMLLDDIYETFVDCQEISFWIFFSFQSFFLLLSFSCSSMVFVSRFILVKFFSLFLFFSQFGKSTPLNNLLLVGACLLPIFRLSRHLVNVEWWISISCSF